MEGWEHTITAREVIRRENCPVERCSTRAEGMRKKRKKQKGVSSDLSPHSEEQSGSKDSILWQ